MCILCIKKPKNKKKKKKTKKNKKTKKQTKKKNNKKKNETSAACEFDHRLVILSVGMHEIP